MLPSLDGVFPWMQKGRIKENRREMYAVFADGALVLLAKKSLFAVVRWLKEVIKEESRLQIRTYPFESKQ